VHAFGYAAEIGVREVLIPLGNGASTLSAYGIAAGDVARFVEVETALRAPFDDAALSREVAGAVERARQSMLDAGVAEDPQIDIWALMRYQEQLMHRLEVPLDPADRGGHPARAGDLSAQFTQEYARRYGPSAASAFQAAEIFALRVRARVPAATRAITGTAASAPGATVGSATRTVLVFWPDAGKRVATTVYDGGGFTDGGEITGPALVELPHTTIAVPRAASLTADRGHFRLLLPAPETAGRGTAQ
jgi:N-methylhydantoinase A